MQIILGLLLGISLSAACGFRIFIPLLTMSIAGNMGMMTLSSEFTWVSSTPALIALSIATIVEIVAYYIPWVDNLLDAISLPLATIAGTMITASCIVDIAPMIKWFLAAIAGGGVAAGVNLGTTAVRGISTTTTGGIANPVVSTVEAGSSAVFSFVSILFPIVGFIVLIIVIGIGIRWYKINKQKSQLLENNPVLLIGE